MSEKNPECPLYNPLNCKEYYNPKLCAFVRKDKICLKKKKPKSGKNRDEAETVESINSITETDISEPDQSISDNG
ncbi:MAG: hypothetical protein WA151_02340 [Desulfatirhabdiaceae bacterium]